MAMRWAVAAAALTGAAVNAQLVATNVNVTGLDGSLRIDWAIPTPDSTIASFRVSVTPQDPVGGTGPVYDTMPGVTVWDFNSGGLDFNSFFFDVGRCVYNGATYASTCSSLVPGTMPDVTNTFAIGTANSANRGAVGAMIINMPVWWGLGTTTGLVSQATGYLRNGLPHIGRKGVFMDKEGLWTSRVGMGTWTTTPTGNTHSGLVLFDWDSQGQLRPLIQFYSHHVGTNNAANYLYLRRLAQLGTSYSTASLCAPCGSINSDFVELGIYRDAANQKYKFFWATPYSLTISYRRWNYYGSLYDVHDTMMPFDYNPANTSIGMFASNEHTTLTRQIAFDRFVETRDPAAINSFLVNVTDFSTRQTPSAGMCNDNRIVTHTGLYYSTSKSTYSYRMFGLQNGQKYTVQITSVNTGGGTNTYTHPRQVQPTIAFPKLNNSATSSPAMFLDSLSVAYGALLQWRDSSGNGRHMVQPLTTMAPISYGWGYTTSYTTSYPAGGVYFSYGGYYEMLQVNKTDTFADLANSPNGMSWFLSYKISYPYPYVYNYGLLSYQRYAYVNSSITDTYYGRNARPMDDSAGWDIWANTNGYDFTTGLGSTQWSGPGMRIVTGKNAGSSTMYPSLQHVGVHYQTASAIDTSTLMAEGTDPTVFTYNYYKVPSNGGNGYNVNTLASYTQTVASAQQYLPGTWILDACRGINLGRLTDRCLVPNYGTGTLASSTSPTIMTGQNAWVPGFQRPTQTSYTPSMGWPEPQKNYEPNNGLGQANGHAPSPATLKLGDGFRYGTSYYQSKNFYGWVFGVLLYKDAIVDRSDRETVQRWLSGRYGAACNVPDYPNTIVSGTDLGCARGGAVGSSVICATSCASGYSRVGGIGITDTYQCITGKGFMMGKGAWCGQTCPLLTMPSNAASCTMQYITETFDYPSTTRFGNLVQYDILPPLVLGRMEDMWTFGNGVLTGSMPYATPDDVCSQSWTTTIGDSLFMVNRPTWGAASVSAGTVAYTIDMVFGDNQARAGLAFRVATASTTVTTYYRFSMVAGVVGSAKLEFVSYSAGTSTVTSFGSNMMTNFIAVPGTTYSVKVVTNGINIVITVNGNTFFTATDANIPHGAIGAWLASGEVRFDNMMMSGSCAANGNCQANTGSSCTYTCASGFVAQGSNQRNCLSSGYDGTNLRCVPPPPTPTNPNPVFSVFEDAAVGTAVGPVNVTVASNGTLDKVVLYSIVGGNNETQRDMLGNPLAGNPQVPAVFGIGYCDGIITVASAGAMSYSKGVQTFNLQVQAALAIDATVFNIIPVTINVLNARNPPAFLNPADGSCCLKTATAFIDENSPIGTTLLWNPSGSGMAAFSNYATALEGPSQTLTYSILLGNEAGFFAVNNATGAITTAKSTLDFEGIYKTPAVQNSFDLLVQVKDRDFPTKQATLQVTVKVADNNDPPVVPVQTIQIIEDAVNQITVLDARGNPVPNIFGTITGYADDDTLGASSDTVSYALAPTVVVSDRNGVKGSTFSTITAANFAINATTGELRIAAPISLGNIIDRNYSVIDGRAVRYKVVLTGSATDSKSILRADGVTMSPTSRVVPTFPINVYVMINASYGGEAIVSSAQFIDSATGNPLSTQTADTAGCQALRIQGEGFSNVPLLRGGDVNVNVRFEALPSTSLVGSSPQWSMPARRFPVYGCQVLDDNNIYCTGRQASTAITACMTGSTQNWGTSPGFGTNLGLVVDWSTSTTSKIMPTKSGSPIIVAYTQPTISTIAFDTSTGKAAPQGNSLFGFSTDGNGALAISVANTGPLTSVIAVTYGIMGYEYLAPLSSLTPSTLSTPGIIRAFMQPGAGTNLVIKVQVGDQTATLTGSALTQGGLIGYAAPTITGIQLSAGSNGTLNALTTLQSTTPQRIDIVGRNFGRITDFPAVVMRYSANIAINGLTNQPWTAAMAPACSKNINTTNTVVTCTVPNGFGAGWSVYVTVGNQTSAVSPTTLSYAAPVLTGVSGVGATKADTAGGQEVILIGSNFGPATILDVSRTPAVPVPPPMSVTYSTVSPYTEYVAVNCVPVLTAADRQISCALAPGSGKNLYWSLSLVGQATVGPSPFTTNYAAPVIVSLSSSSSVYNTNNQDYLTEGGSTQQVYIDGTNFGQALNPLAMPSAFKKTTTVTYLQKLDMPRNVLNSSLGADSQGVISYTAQNCVLTVEHYQIRCDLQPGAGLGLQWTVTVNTQASTEPLMGYRTPRILSITMADSSPADAISTDGGETLLITGTDFGPASPNCNTKPASYWPAAGTTNICTGLIQQLTYGPLGSEYRFADVHIKSSTQILVRTRPGFGGPFTATVQVADQFSPAAGVFGYAKPYVTGVMPTSGPTNPAVDSVEVRITGANFGLNDPLTAVSVLFGNPSDNTLYSQILPTHAPDGRTPGAHAVSFFLPRGLMNFRAVRVIVHPLGQPNSALRVISDPMDVRSAGAAFFDYVAPEIDNVVVSALPNNNVAERQALEQWLINNLAGASSSTLSSVLKLVVVGANFGPAQGVNGDNVVRGVMYLGQVSSTPYAAIKAWDDNRIEMYSYQQTGDIYVQHQGKTYDNNDLMRSSNVFSYSRISPQAIKASFVGLNTAGGDKITVTFQFLASTLSSLEVYVEVASDANNLPVYTRARMFNPTTHAEIDPTNQASVAAYINAQVAAAPSPDAAVFPLEIMVPAGDGVGRKIFVLRDASDKSDAADITLSYAAPVIQSFQVYDEFTSTWGPVMDASQTIVLPTLGTKIKVNGANFGLCPSVAMTTTGFVGMAGPGAAYPLTLPQYGTPASGAVTTNLCAAGSTGAPVGEPANTHTNVTMWTAPGQGSGKDVDSANGYTLSFKVSGQTSAIVRTRYMDPTITSATPTGRTTGGDTLTIQGKNLGATSMGLSVNLVKGSTVVACTNATLLAPAANRRTDAAYVICKIPEGSGAGYDIVLSTTSYACADSTVQCKATRPAGFDYQKPAISNVYYQGVGNVSADWSDPINAYAAWVQNGAPSASAVAAPAFLTMAVTGSDSITAYGSALAAMNATGTRVTGTPVRLPANGGYIVTLEGDNFGVYNTAKHCLFFAWGGRDRAAPLTCNGAIDTVGENEIPALAILHWSHTRIVIVAPSGTGGREIIVKVNGVEPIVGTPMHYKKPVITRPLDPATGGTDGGEAVTVYGVNFGTYPIDTTSPSVSAAVKGSAGPITKPLWPSKLSYYLTDHQAPQAVTRINFFRKCMSAYLDKDGAQPPVVSACSAPVQPDNGIQFIHTDSSISFETANGIGVHRAVTVEIWDLNSTTGAWFNYTSDPVFFDYQKPQVYAVANNPIKMTQDTVAYEIDLMGRNLGNPPANNSAADAWSDAEKLTAVTVDGMPCVYGADLNTGADLRSVSGTAAHPVVELKCYMPSMTVGYHNLSYTVAGQSNGNPITAVGTIPFLVCRANYFGYAGEMCAACPYGAKCSGFVTSFVDRTTAATELQTTTDGGMHTYPRPLAGFYNLNSSNQFDRNTASESMYSACPDKIASKYPGRDVCIVGCDPVEACLGDNYCAYGYRSIAPLYRCNYCDTGFYKRGNECVKCPDSPYALIVGFCALVLVAAIAAFFLNKKKINIGFIAIGVDWAQVIAIFSSSQVAWPPIVKDLFHILSAFNLNIEIVAPECIVPDLQYKQKWSFIMALPLSLTIFLMVLTGFQVLYLMFIKGRKVSLSNQGSSFMSMTLLLMYVLYIYLTRNILDIFNCQPRDPDEGKLYLTAGAGEECYVAGGTQQTLFPAAVAACVFYILGYPAVVATLLWRNRNLAMEDQLLRAKGCGDDRLTNPRAYVLRKRFSRIYYQFRPDCILWILAIILRKFCLAATYILFNRNATFQLAAALLVLFVAYAAQMKFRPYMGFSDMEAVVRDFQMKAASGDKTAALLWSRLKNVESRGRKKVRRNLMNSSGAVDMSAVLGVLQNWLFGYNTVEEIMLFSAGTVAIMGIMYASLDPASTTFADAKDSVTWVIVGAIILTIIYFFSVVFTEVYVLWTEDQRRKQLEKRQKSKAGRGGKDVDTDKADKEAKAAVSDLSNLGSISTSFNPLFDGAQSTSGLREAVAKTYEPPTVQLWALFRQGYSEMQSELTALQSAAAEIRVREQKMAEAAAMIERATGHKVEGLPEITNAAGETYRAGKRKMQFGPVSADSEGSPALGSASPMALRRMPSAGAGVGASMRSLSALKKK